MTSKLSSLYKLNPDHAYIVVFAFFLLGAGLKYTGECVYERVAAQEAPVEAQLSLSEAAG